VAEAVHEDGGAEAVEKSMKAPPRLIVTQKRRYMTARNMGMPSQRFSTTLSIASLAVFWAAGRLKLFAAAAWMKP